MNIVVKDISVPAEIGWNYEEIKAEVNALAKKYSGMVYTEDDIKSAKADRASLNKLKKALNEERLKRERAYMAPFAEFKAQVNEIIQIIDEPVKLIDTQVKAYQDKQREAKQRDIDFIIAEADIPVDKATYWNPKWLNESTSIAQIRKDIEAVAEKVQADYTIMELQLQPEYAAVAKECYQKTMDLSRAFAKAKEMADYDEMKKRMEEERKAREEEQKKREEEAVEEIPVEITPQEFEETVEEIPKEFTDIPEEFKGIEENNWDIGARWEKLEVLIDGGQKYVLLDFLAKRGIQYRMG